MIIFKKFLPEMETFCPLFDTKIWKRCMFFWYKYSDPYTSEVTYDIFNLGNTDIMECKHANPEFKLSFVVSYPKYVKMLLLLSFCFQEFLTLHKVDYLFSVLLHKLSKVRFHDCTAKCTTGRSRGRTDQGQSFLRTQGSSSISLGWLRIMRY